MSDLREQLQAIYDERGRLTPSLVVDAARNPEHPLHARFEWDDARAGEEYRKVQAGELIRSVKVTRECRSAPRELRAFYSVRRETGPSYEPIETVAQDPFMARLVRSDMEREWRSLKRRYEEFDEFWEMVRGSLPAA